MAAENNGDICPDTHIRQGGVTSLQDLCQVLVDGLMVVEVLHGLVKEGDKSLVDVKRDGKG